MLWRAIRSQQDDKTSRGNLGACHGSWPAAGETYGELAGGAVDADVGNVHGVARRRDGRAAGRVLDAVEQVGEEVLLLPSSVGRGLVRVALTRGFLAGRVGSRRGDALHAGDAGDVGEALAGAELGGEQPLVEGVRVRNGRGDVDFVFAGGGEVVCGQHAAGGGRKHGGVGRRAQRGADCRAPRCLSWGALVVMQRLAVGQDVGKGAALGQRRGGRGGRGCCVGGAGRGRVLRLLQRGRRGDGAGVQRCWELVARWRGRADKGEGAGKRLCLKLSLCLRLRRVVVGRLLGEAVVRQAGRV